MNIFAIIFLVGICLGFSTDRETPNFKPLNEKSFNFNIQNKTFMNYIDHFSGTFRDTFAQRYYLVDDYCDHKQGPAILHLCGENECKFPYYRLFPLQVTEYFKGIYVAIEHRYYGVSQPAKDLSLENLKYLNHEQALADYAYFIEKMTIEYTKTYGYTPKWIIVGGSYAGALSAWFGLKYPHLIAGAWSSSGVVTPILNFWTFERQIINDYLEDSKECYDIMKKYHQAVEDKLLRSTEQERKQFLKLFTDDEKITNDEFWFYFADMAVEFPQYSFRKGICDIVKKLNNSGRSIEAQLHEFAKEGRNFGTRIEDYMYKLIGDEKIVPESMARQWTYQYCTSYAWFQTPYLENPLRYVGMDVEYWLRYCKGGLGELIIPKVNHTDAMFGGELIANTAQHIFFTNARNDPWKWSGIIDTNQKNEKIEVGVMDCPDCGHCRELYTPKDDDPIEVKNMRQRIIKAIEKWLK